MFHRFLAVATIVVLCFAPLAKTRAQTVWSGYDFSFSKADFTDYLLPENQDRITENVWISRGTSSGIFNVHDEVAYFPSASPAGTEWATYLNNPTETIAATNYSNLTFAPWITAYGGEGSSALPARLTGGNAVVHLITDDIYLDIRFTQWTQGGGGGFAYVRALPPVPEPSAVGLLLAAMTTAHTVRLRRTPQLRTGDQ
jgi:hypothetical protein